MNKNDYQNKYNKKRAKILLKGIIPSFLGIFLPKDKKRIIFNSTRNDFFNFNTKYIFEYFIKNHPQFECKYVINEQDKRDKLNQKYGKKHNYFIEAESINNIFYIIRANTWILSALETPVGGFFLKKNRFVFHVGHGAYFRSALFLENNLPWKKKLYYNLIKNNFSYHLITSNTIAKIAPQMFGCKKKQIVVLGDPMNDMVYTPNIELIKKSFGASTINEKNILYMPTWRQDGSLKLFPFDDIDYKEFSNFLKNNNINIFLRMHPSYEEDLSFYTNLSSRFKIIDTAKVEDINEVIGFFDLVITDYSSGHIGYMLTRKPLLFLPYDLKSYEKRMGFVVPYDESTPGPKPKSFKKFKIEITNLLSKPNYYLKERQEAISIFNKYERDNTKRVSKFIIETI